MSRPFLLLLALLPAPIAVCAAGPERPGKEVVESICANCHKAGLNGAPKIGDREAWVPRMKIGLPELSLSAIRGHGGMPARGGHAELTDGEIRGAIVYMFDPGAEARAASRSASAPAPKGGRNEATVNGLEVRLGLMSAERLRAYPRGSPEALMHGGVPSGSGYYHVNVTLRDAGKQAGVRDAAVEIVVVQAGSETQRKPLETMGGQNPSSYGAYVRLAPRTPSSVTVRIRPAGSDRVTEARFTPTPE